MNPFKKRFRRDQLLSKITELAFAIDVFDSRMVRLMVGAIENKNISYLEQVESAMEEYKSSERYRDLKAFETDYFKSMNEYDSKRHFEIKNMLQNFSKDELEDHANLAVQETFLLMRSLSGMQYRKEVKYDIVNAIIFHLSDHAENLPYAGSRDLDELIYSLSGFILTVNVIEKYTEEFPDPEIQRHTMGLSHFVSILQERAMEPSGERI